MPAKWLHTRFEKMSIKIEFFYSKTCPYCPAAKKMLYELVKNLKEPFEVKEIDAWSKEGEPLTEKYGIQMVPTIVVNGMKCGEGITNKQQLVSALRSVHG
jgi:thiol-disulfide isomerase/thioredoxin